MKKTVSKIFAIFWVSAMLFMLVACSVTAYQAPDSPENRPTATPSATQDLRSPPPDTNDSDDLLTNRQKAQAEHLRQVLDGFDGNVSDKLIESFFSYYLDNQYELRFLPVFGDEKTPDSDWDTLTLFALCLCESERNAEGYSVIPTSEFERIVRILFSPFEYTHRSSSLFNYDDATGYTAVGFGIHGGMFYRLKSLTRDEQDVWSAAFDGFSFDEFDFMSPEQGGDYYSANMEALIEYSGGKYPDDVWAALLKLFLQGDYDDILLSDQFVEITFKLQDDLLHPLLYLSHSCLYIERARP